MITRTIPKHEWKDFFDQLSRELIDWEVTVEVLSGDVGAQMLSEGLAFAGITYEDDKIDMIEIELGDSVSNQAHNIARPVAVSFESSGNGPKGILEIEDGIGAKTLIRFIRPYPVPAERTKTEIVSAK